MINNDYNEVNAINDYNGSQRCLALKVNANNDFIAIVVFTWGT